MFSGFEKIIQATVLNWWVGPDRPGIFGWALGWEGVGSTPSPSLKGVSSWNKKIRRMDTLQGTNISPKNGILKMVFLFPRWDMLISWRVYIFFQNTGQQKGMRSLTKTLKKKSKAKPPFTKLVTFPQVWSWCFFFGLEKPWDFFSVKSLNSEILERLNLHSGNPT